MDPRIGRAIAYIDWSSMHFLIAGVLSNCQPMIDLYATGSPYVEFAKKFGVIFEVRSSLNDNPGTLVKEETANMEGVVVRGVALDKNQAKVTLIEKDRMGGDCLNTGCVPSKALIKSARLLSQIRRAPEFGIRAVSAELDFAALMERVQRVFGVHAPDWREQLLRCYHEPAE